MFFGTAVLATVNEIIFSRNVLRILADGRQPFGR